MLSFTTITFTIIFFSSHIYAASNCVTVTQTKSNSWSSGSQTFSQWQVKLENTGSTVAKDITLSFSPALADSYEIVKQTNGEYTLPTWLTQNGGIQPKASHSFGYTIQSANSATISINCGGSSSTNTPAPTPKPTPKPTSIPTPSPDPTPTPRATPSPTSTPTSTPTTTPTVPPSVPVTPTTTPTVAPTSAPTSSPSAATTHCDIVFIIDNYIMRQTTLSDSEIIAKYTNYFKDVQSFYRDHFNMEMRISSFYLEKDGSFSDTMDENVLLDNLRSGLLGNFFPGVPASACVYHLITGRDLYGIGGLAWVGTACGINTFNLGLTVDLNGVEDGTSVIRRLTHEIGHTLGGQHFDFYQADLLYTCTATPDDSERRILRKENENEKREAYQFLADDLHFSQCATSTIRNSLSSFSCLWDENKATVPAYLTLYSEANYGGDSNQIPAYNGAQACYNILYPYAGTLSSYQVADSGSSTFRIGGVKFFSHNDCVGDSFDLGLSSSFVGASNDKKALSYMFIRA